MRPQWDLRVVGECNLLAHDGAPTNLSAKSKRFAVLAFLAIPIPGQRVRRDVLLATFWPELDTPRARNALRATLHQLRQTLGPDAIRGSGEEELWLDSALIHVDLSDLAAALEAGEPEPWLARTSLELVPGLHVPDAGPFDAWLSEQRRWLNARLVIVAWEAADAAESASDLVSAVRAARAATRLAREDETGLCRLISLLDRSGDRGGALAQFDLYERWLRDEYEAEPSPETRALVQRVRDRTRGTAAPNVGDAEPPPGGSSTGAVDGSMLRAPTAPEPTMSPPVGTRGWSRRSVAGVGAMLAMLGVAATFRSNVASPPVDGVVTPLVVVPFRSEIVDSAARYLAPALGESVTDELASPAVVPYAALRTVDPNDSTTLKRRLRDVGATAVVLGVLAGTRDSLELLVSVQTTDGRPLIGARRFRGSERDLVVLRDSVVALIVRAAALPVRDVRARHVPAPAAYQLSLNAAWLLGRRSRTELLSARDLYTKALEIDPAWAELWLGLARVNGMLAYRQFIEYRPGLLASERAANEALRRAPSDGRALIERSLARFQLGDNVGAEADARRAAALDSTDWHMQSLIGTWWQWSGNHLDSALFYTRRARRLAPWDRQTAINVLQIVGCMPDSTLILDEARRVLDMDPAEPAALEMLAWTLTRFGRWDEATGIYERRYASLVARGVTAPTAGLTGESRFRATVRAIRRAEYEELRAVPSATPALLENRIALFEDLGMRDSSIAALSSVVDSLDAHHANMMCAHNLRDFRRDDRTLRIVRARGWPMAEFTLQSH